MCLFDSFTSTLAINLFFKKDSFLYLLHFWLADQQKQTKSSYIFTCMSAQNRKSSDFPHFRALILDKNKTQ